MTATCSHEDTRLSCIECNAPICSNCFIQCPVGFRCAKCNGSAPKRAASPAGGLLSVFKSLVMCICMGVAAGYALPFINFPFISCIICYIVGMLAGRLLARVLDYSIGDKLGTVVVFGLLIGMSLTPYKNLVLVIAAALTGCFSAGGGELFGVLTGIVSILFCPVCFFAGALRPVLWGDRF